MPDTATINNQVPSGEQPSPKRKLYDKLHGAGMYGKTFDEFSTQFNNPDRVNKLFTKLKQGGLWSKSEQEFTTKFFGDLPDTSSKPVIGRAAPAPAPAAVPSHIIPQAYTPAPVPGMFQTVTDEDLQQGAMQREQERIIKVQNASNVVSEVWKDSDKYARDLIYEQKQKAKGQGVKLGSDFLSSKMYAAPEITQTGESTTVNRLIPPELKKMQQEQEKANIWGGEIAAVKADPNTHPAILKKAVIEKKKAGLKEEANKISAAVYALKSDERDSPQVRENISLIEQGKLVYNIEKDEVYKPLNPLEAVKHGYDERNRANDNGGRLMLMSKADRIKFAEEELGRYDPDKPIPVPGTVSEMAGSEGLATFKSLTAAAVVSFLTKNPTAGATAAAAASAPEYGRRAYYDEFVRSYAQVKKTLQTQHPDWTEAQLQAVSEEKANANASIAATSDAIVNGIMTYSGLKLGSKALNANLISFDKGAINAFKQITKGAITIAKKGAPEGFTNAAVAAGAQAIRNIASNELGIQREESEGVLAAGGTMLAMHYGIAGLHFGGGILAGAAKKALLNSIAKHPIDIVAKATADMLEKNVITPIEADITVDVVKRRQAFAEQFPNVKEDATLDHLENLTEDYNNISAKLAKPEEGGVHESLHKGLKEKQKIIEDEINLLSETPENQIKILKTKRAELQKEIDEHDAAKAEGKPGKLEDSRTTRQQVKNIDKQMESAQAKVDDPVYKAQKIIDEDIADAYAEWTTNDNYTWMAKNHPKEFLRFVAEQARGGEQPVTDADGSIRMVDTRATTSETFGKELVKLAEDAWPVRQPASVIQPGEMKSGKVITIKPQENIPLFDGAWSDAKKIEAAEAVGWTPPPDPQGREQFISNFQRTRNEVLEDIRNGASKEDIVKKYSPLKNGQSVDENGNLISGSPDQIDQRYNEILVRTLIEPKTKNNKNAIQEPSAAAVDVRQSSGDGPEVGARNQGQRSTGEEAPEITGETQEVDLSTPPPDADGTPIKRLDTDNLTPFTTKSKRQTVTYENGDLVVRDRDGNILTDTVKEEVVNGKKKRSTIINATRKKALQEYAEEFDYSHGERATEPPEGVRSETEIKRHIIESSRNPLEIAELYAMEEPQTAPLNTVERMIADYGLGKVTRDSYINFGDRNNIGMSKAKSYFSNEGAPIDVVAKELSDHYGVEITPADIVDFIDRFPNGVTEALRKVETAVAGEASAKFQELTGLKLNKEVAEKAIDKALSKLSKAEQEIAQHNYESLQQTEETFWDTYEATDGFTSESARASIEQGSSEAPGTGAGEGEPPVRTPPPGKAIHIQHPETVLSHRGLQDVANEFGLADVKPRDRKSDLQLRTDADRTMRKWAADGTYNQNIEKLIVEGERGSILNDEQRVILEQHIANLSAELRTTPRNTAEFDNKLAGILRVKNAGEKTRSEAGAALRIPLGGSEERTYGDFLVTEMDTGKVSKLTEQEKAITTDEFEKISSTVEELAASKAKDEAAAALAQDTPKPKRKSSGRKKKTHEDFVKEREQIKQSIKDKWKNAGKGELSVVPVPYARQLMAIAPDVVKMARNLVEEGVTQLSDVVKRLHTDLKDDIPDLTEKDVHNILAGEYTEKKQTKNEIAEQLRDLQTEAKLINKLEAALAGEPKAEKAKQKKNQRIEELSKKLKEVNREHSSRTPEEIADKAASSRIEKEIKDLQEKLSKSDFETAPKKEVIYSEETIKLRDKLYKLRQERKIRLAEKEYKNRTWDEKTVDVVTAPVREVRSVVSAFDASFPLRQGIIPTSAELVTNPRRAVVRMRRMLKAGGSKKYFDGWMAELKDSEDFKIMQESGLDIVDPDTITNREEVFQSRYAEKIPILGTIGIKGSERMYSHFANSQRVDLFKRGVDMMQAQGMTWRNSAEQYKAWANVVNTMTGRGKLIGPFANSAKLLSLGFFSPRLIASRLAFFNPKFYKSIPGPLRKMVAQQMVTFVALGTGMLFALKAFVPDAEVEWDPRSPDFGKIKVGDTRWDMWGGFQQYIRLFSTILSLSKKTSSGDVVPLFNEEGKGKAGDVFTAFMRSKASPAVSAAINVMEGETIVGDPTNLKEEAKKFFIPLLWKDVYEVAQEKGTATAIAVAVPGFFGVGSQTYKPKKPKGSTAGKQKRPQREQRQQQQE